MQPGPEFMKYQILRAENVNLNTGLIQLMGKGAKERYVQIGSTSVLNILRKYYAEKQRRRLKKKWIFFCKMAWATGIRNSPFRLMLKKYNSSGWNRKKYHTAYVPAFICDILDRRRRRYKLCTTDTGAQFDKDNTDLYSCGSRNSGGDTAEKAPAE